MQGSEARTDIYDRLLLFLLTGNEIQSCMENWLGDDLEFMDTKLNFDKYLSAQPEDMDLSYFEQDDLEKILILPNGHMIDAS